MDEDDYRDDGYEWSEAKSADRMARSGFDFHAARRVLESDRYVERWDERHSGLDEERVVATGMLGPAYISVVYTPRGVGNVSSARSKPMTTTSPTSW
ncbi:MAG: BrnT family toxin [Candidatus Eremiobacteraeota bacterium]|nr:BrnT family toxin [Candidatus Eremiobacteraeota bacterium]